MSTSLGIQASAFVKRETRLRIPGGANNVMTSPDHASFVVTDFDAEWFGTLDDVTVTADQAVIGQWSTVSLQRSWSVRIAIVAAGLQLRLWTSRDGSTSVSTPDNNGMLSLTAGQPFGVRASRRASDGWTYLWYSPTDPPAWSLINGSGVAVNAGTLLNSTAAMMIGGYGASAGSAGHAVGYFRRGVVRNGFAGAGSVIATPDVTAVSEAATGFTDSTGKVWTVGGTADLMSVIV